MRRAPHVAALACGAAAAGAGTWATLPDKALRCSGEEFKGDLGKMDSAGACGAAAQKRGGVNYAVWRGDDDSHCYACAITARGDPSTWQYDADAGATSFAGTCVLATTWTEVDDQAITCSSDEYRGDVGKMDSAAACADAARQRGGVNYAVWRGDTTKDCYVCAVTARGAPGAWQYAADPGATSFAASACVMAPTPAPAPPATPTPEATPAPKPLPPGAWDRIGPWNIFDDKDFRGESGTLACAASPKGQPDLIYAGGQNNGVSSGIIKTVDGGKHWVRRSNGLWDTRVLGVWVYPDDYDHVLVGTHSGIYESTDGAASWAFRNDTTGWGNVMSFREGVIQGKPYILANYARGIATMPKGGGTWQQIPVPGGGGLPANQHLSVAIHDGNTEVVTCVGGWGGGVLYYATIHSATNATWTGPLKANGGDNIDCSNAAVDPNDRDHFLYSHAQEWRAWESKDGGKTVREVPNHDAGVFFVMIDTKGWLYTATQDGAFVSQDGSKTWNPYHVVMHSRSGKVVDRVPHDYQRIVPDFRGDAVAFPSDQGLHLVDGASSTLASAVGDMRNCMTLSALISPNARTGSRNLVVNMWDWDVVASWDDGHTWAGWADSEKSPGACGEGGGGQGMGASGRVVMFHGSRSWSSEDGGHNFKQVNLPGNAAFGDYVRRAGSRSEPAGTCFGLLDNPEGRGDWEEDDEDEDDDRRGEMVREMRGMDPETYARRVYTPGLRLAARGTKKFLMTSEDFGQNWTWRALPDSLQAGALAVDPTRTDALYAVSTGCLASSSDSGRSWSPCSAAAGLTGSFSKLLVKGAGVMFMLRNGAVPLRTRDGGASWHELAACAPLFRYGATMDGSLSWSGNTLVLHGVDLGAVGRGEYGTAVWKSSNDGDDWVDETGDLVTISPGPGVWYEKDFYLVTRGEGVTVKRNFEA